MAQGRLPGLPVEGGPGKRQNSGMDTAYDVPMIVRAEGRGGLLRLNRKFSERWGFTVEELAGRSILDWIHPEDRDALAERFSARSGRVEARHETKSGEWLPLVWHVREHQGEAVAFGRPSREAGGEGPPSTDSGPRNATMGDTLNAMALIVESKNPGLRCSILLVDPNREYIIGGAGPSLPVAYNQAVEGLRLGPSVGSCGTAAFWNEPVVVEDIVRDPLWQDLREAAAIAGVRACWSHPVTTTGGDVLGAMALYSDAPSAPTRHQMDGLEIAARMVGLAVERDRLEQQLERASKMEAIGVLAGGVAHDFNNLLAIVMGNAELALADLPAGSATTAMLREIVTASANAGELCNQLLAYAGRGALSAEGIECNAFVRELGNLMLVALSKKAHLDYALSPDPLGLRADRSQLRQVVMNLITNAAEAVGDCEGVIEIGTQARALTREELARRHPDAGLQGGDYVCLWVRDSGSGMSAATQERIFDPFFTTKSSGRGLGLAAVQGIVRGHGGVVELESAPGIGTTFTVLLPRFDPPGHKEAAPADEEVHGDACVLVVDDEEMVRRVCGGVLEKAGYRVVYATDGAEAVEVFRRHIDEIDCVLLDLSMPCKSGAEVFVELRELRANLPVVLSSGFAEQELLDRFRGAGLADVVQKPAPRQVLLSKIAAAIRPELV